MNKRILAFTMLLTATVFAAQANPVDQRTAREAATKFVNANTKVSLRGSDELQLATTYHINRSDAAFYIFNMANGFVIVAADDCAIPILGYSDEGMPFDPNDIPVQMEEYLQGFVEQIQYGVENHIQPDESTTRQWEMVMATGRLNDNRSTNAVEPLLTERWNQGCYYNAMCPEDSQGPCGHTYVGCAAAAMGQIMHYWGYPETGGGSHSYTPSGYPIQSVNFWETTYDWEHMPDELTSSSSNAEVNAVATLLWHCGVSINMMYGHNGSGAYPNAVPAALTEYFNYSSDLYSQNKGDDATWLNLVKSSLDLGRPIHYSGWNGAGGGGHSFVCDGYDSNNQLHFNWGWSGNGNGYFALNALIVSGSNFSYNNYAIFNIHPYEGTETYTITTQSNPAEGGTTTGDGNYNYAHTCTLTATQNENYLFVNWTKNGYQVSSEPICHVTVREDATYVANFRRTNIDEIVIGDATNSSDHLPLTSSNRYSLSQQIYTAEEINANGPITDISFYHAGSLTGSAPLNINLYLKHTQKSSFTSDSDWETLSSDDLCYSGSYLIDGTSGWKQISLETPFNYNGSDNLLVCIDNNTGSNLSNLPWATFESNANLSLTAYSDTLNYNPFSPIGGIIGSFRNQIALTFQVTQGTDFVVTPDPINLGYRPSGCWMRPVSIGLYNSGMTTTISNISSSNSFFTLDTQNIEFPLVFEYHDQAEIQLSTSSGNGLIDASLNISYGNGQTKQTQLFATAYTPAVTDVWETAQEITAFPFSANISNSFLPLYDNYRLPNTDIPDGPDAVYKITLDEETLLSASITNGENGKVALYTENFRGLDGPDTDNSFDSNNPINEWLYYVRLGSNLYHVSSNGNIHWGIMFPVSKLQPYLYTWLTKVALYETPNNMQSITLNIYLGGDSAPGTLVLTQDFMPLSNGIHEIDLNSEILIDGTQNLWITFNQKGDAAPASYAPITTDPNSHWLSSNGITWDNNNSGISFPIQGFFTNATGTTLCMGNSNPRDVNQMDLMPGTYYLVASSTSDNWDLEINTQPIIGPIPASNPNPAHQSSGTDYVETQLSWTLGEGTTEYKVLFGKTPNCEQVLVTWTSDLANSYTFTTDLDWNSTYYWRVCERNSNCPNGISSPLWSFTTGNFVPREREIIASCYPSAGGAVSGAGIYTDGSTCTLTASPYSGYMFKRWADEDGRTISTNNSYSFVVHGNQNLIAIFAHTGNIPFADSNLKARCVAHWDANGDGELSYSEAANVTNIGNVFQNKRDFTSFDELQYFTALTSIGYWAFLGCQTMTSITIPRFVSNIANESFYAVYALGSISVVEENTHYDSRNNCNAIIDTRTNQLIVGCKNTVVPNTVTSIGYMAFGDCRNLTSINLPNSIQSIGANAFESCISLGSITLPNSLTSIGNEAFVACNALSSVTIPSSVTNIGLNPFSYCTSLAHINVESGNPRYDSRDNCDAIIENSTNQLILGTPNTMIPNTVTSIAEKAFSGYNNLISITVPRNVTTIGDYAFSGNHNLRSISVLAETPPTLGAEPFRFLDKNLIAIHVPCELTSTYQSASGWSEFPIFQERTPYYLTATTANPNMGDAVVVHLPDCSDNIARVLATPYTGCTFVNWTSNGIEVSTSANYEFSLESDINLIANFISDVDWDDPIVFADANVKAICVTHWDTNGDGELSYNEAMSIADIGDIFKRNRSITSFDEFQYFTGLTNIPVGAFLGCRSLTSIMIPRSVTRIEGSAFNTCLALSSIVIPHSVTYMGRDAFTNCEGLTSMTILNEVPPTIEDVTFLFVDTSIPVYIPCGSYYSYSEAIFWNAFTNFIEICDSYHNITVNTNPIEGGMVTGMGSIGEGAVCRLTAIPNGGFSFANWTQDGMVVSTDNPYSFIVTEDATFVANFTFNGYEVTATSCPAIGGTIYGAGVFNQGATCTLTAIPNDGYSFIRWREGSETVCTDSIYSFLVSSPRNLVADFYFDDGSTGILSGVFSVSDNTQVHFSQGNLQYQASTSTWRFAESQWDYMGNGNANISSTYDGWIDLFCWGTSGYNHGAVCYQPWSSSQNDGDYYAYGSPNYNLFDQTGKADWGYNAISNGGNQENLWRSLTCEEWGYVLTLRTTTSGILYVKARVNNINGIILLPDDWDASYYSLSNTNTGNANYDGNIITASQWNTLEQHGAVFLPAAGYRMGTSLGVVNTGARYWSSSHQNNNYSLYMDFGTSYLYTQWGNDRYLGGSVRLVCSLQSNTTYSINATHYPEEGGSVTGCGDYAEGSTCTLTALANDGYTFNNWTENGNVVSTNAYYSFTVTGDRNLVANFLIQGNIPTGSTNGRFSVGDSLQVYFSQGNLQYQASTNTWRFALHQWDYVGEGNNNISDSYSGWIDLFCWGTSGYNHGANCYQPWSTSQNNSDYKVYGSYFYNLYDQTGQADWGYNAISNGGNTEGLWRTLNKDEWDYVFNTRNTVSGIRWVQGKVDGKNGTILLPDNWDASLYPLNDANGGNFSSNTITTEDWNSIFEVNGAVFLPPSGRRLGNSGSYRGTAGDYWSSSYCNSNSVYYVYLGGGDVYTQGHTRDRKYGLAVRLVRNAESVVSYGINASPNPAEGGTVTGTGLYDEGTTCTLTAIPNEGYAFARWKEGNETVSTDNIFTFVVMANRDFVADFTPIGGTPGALNGVFSVSDTSQVHFSQGNLQYIGSAASPYWKFAENQWDILGITTGQNSSNQNVDRDLFGWGTSGYNHGAVCYQPWSISTTNGDYYAYGNSNFNLYDQTNQADWGYNAISNGGNTENIGWRTPTTDEWDYIFNTRTASTVNGIANARYAKAKVADVQGMILFPDNYTHPSEVTQPVGINSPGNAGWTGNNYSSADFALMESNGAVFLPAAGDRSGTSVIHIGTDASYWSSSRSDSNNAYHLLFYNSSLVQRRSVPRKDGDAVRLIIPVMNNSSYDINAAPNPAEGGTVTGTGLYDEGTTCTLTATANEGYTFTNWTENGNVVSTDAEYTFVVNSNRDLVANFTTDYHWNVNIYNYSNSMTVVGIIRINEVEQTTNMLEIGAFCGDECRGRERLSDQYYAMLGHYYVFLTVYGDNDNTINFRLYDYSLGTELDYVCASMTFVTNNTTGNLVNPYVFDFVLNTATQTTSLFQGWNWWSTYIDVEGYNSLGMLEEALGTNALQIKSQNGFAQYLEVPGYGGYWYGTLDTILSNRQTYMIQTSSNCQVEISGTPVSPADHPITILPGWNWIGFPSSTAISFTEAFAGFTPTDGDQVKSQSGFTQYIEISGYGGFWYGGLETGNLTPGKGLMYKSMNTENATLVYPNAGRSVENVAYVEKHWTNDVHAYSGNMTLMAVVELDNVELASDNYELAAFADGECRGSARLTYVEALNRYFAFLTIAGDEAADLTFGLYNHTTGEESFESSNVIVYTTDASVGSFNTPMVVRFRGTTGSDEWANNLKVYPNPVARGQRFSIGLDDVTSKPVRVEIVNALGVTVSVETSTSLPSHIEAPNTAGVYMLRVFVEGKGTCVRKLVVK